MFSIFEKKYKKKYISEYGVVLPSGESNWHRMLTDMIIR